MNIKIKTERLLAMFFTWVKRTFTPHRYAADQAIEASRRVVNPVLDTRGGQGNRDRIAQVIKITNTVKGSKFLKRKHHAQR